ncbi:wax ester/triacylglycerol synthase domain-containing protein [Nocardia macrotermitis]|nr:wax ester/triacylglycerol synthase domain-containing protein [Nocardia macrotermitis]
MSLYRPAAPDLLTHTFLAMEQAAPDASDVYFGVLLRCGGVAPSVGELRAQVMSRVGMVPALTHRLNDAVEWEPDPEFDIENHVLVADGPVDVRPVREWMPDPPGHDHPLWRMWLLPGTGAEWGLAFAVHHGVLDGTGVMRALEVLFAGRAGSTVDDEVSGSAVAALRAVPNMLRTLRSAPELNVFGELTGERRSDTAAVPVARLRAIADAAQVSVGQVHLVAMAGAVRRWTGVDADVPVCVPVDTRRSDEHDRSGVHLGLVRIALPTATEDPMRRIRLAAQRMSQRRMSSARIGARALIDNVPVRWSGPALQRLGDRRKVALTASVFRSAPGLSILGRPVADLFALPWLPPGHGCFTILARYGATATLSVLTDTGVRGADELARGWAREVAVLADAAGVAPHAEDTAAPVMST